MNVAAAFVALGIALGLGLLVGMQRERSKPPVAGVRTFALITLLGCVSAMLGDRLGVIMPAVALGAVAAAMVVGNLFVLKRAPAPPGITTEVAILLMFLVGVVCWTGPRELAVVLGGVTALLLHAKPMLHRFVQTLGETDVRAIMRFVLLALVILPVLPDRGYGPPPFDVLNPFHVWLVVVLVVGISLAGYLAFKFLGPRAGMILGGLLGGLISSTATTVSFARHAAASRGVVRGSAAVIMLASTMVYARVLTEVAVVAPGHVAQIAGPIVALGVLSAALAILVWFFARSSTNEWPEPGNPTELRSALLFGALYACVLVGASAAKQHFGESGLYAVAALSGLTDMDAITLSTARMVQDERLSAGAAWRAIVIASIASQIFKLGIVAVLGGARLTLILGGLFGVKMLAAAALLVWW